MIPTAIGTVRWRSMLPADHRYLEAAGRIVTVARFPDDPDWYQEAWSVVVETDAKPDHEREVGARIRFLTEAAPHERLHTGAHLTLTDGSKEIADVVITMGIDSTAVD